MLALGRVVQDGLGGSGALKSSPLAIASVQAESVPELGMRRNSRAARDRVDDSGPRPRVPMLRVVADTGDADVADARGGGAARQRVALHGVRILFIVGFGIVETLHFDVVVGDKAHGVPEKPGDGVSCGHRLEVLKGIVGGRWKRLNVLLWCAEPPQNGGGEADVAAGVQLLLEDTPQP